MIVFMNESDRGTVLMLADLADGDTEVTVEMVTDGEFGHRSSVPVADWPAFEARTLADGFVPGPSIPFLHVALHTNARAVVVGNRDVFALAAPEPDEDPMIDLADSALTDGGFLRLGEWWRTGPDTLTTVAGYSRAPAPSLRAAMPVSATIEWAAGVMAAAVARDAGFVDADVRTVDQFRLRTYVLGLGYRQHARTASMHMYTGRTLTGLRIFSAALRDLEAGRLGAAVGNAVNAAELLGADLAVARR